MAKSSRTYQGGFGNHFESEAITGALPRKQNSPREVPFDLYAEQVSGTAFTAPRRDNRRTWLYKIRPSVVQSSYRQTDAGLWQTLEEESVATPERLRWDPIAEPKKATDFLAGIQTAVVNGSPRLRTGCAAHHYTFNRAMGDRYLSNADGEFLFLPEKGAVLIKTELGELEVLPGEIAVVPRGIKFQVEGYQSESCRGYLGENFGEPFRLPELGPVGANSLADPRHFLAPTAKYEDKKGKFQLITRYQGALWQVDIDRSPLDVVAWQGNYVPYKYDLNLFQTVGSISVDHPDPSIFTVLTSASAVPGTANCDFVIFPPRWLVAKETFRPPYFHRNVMSEYMGLIKGKYDAKAEGFIPGSGSLHNSFAPHGPDTDTYQKAIQGDDSPQFVGETMAFMFESSLPYRVAKPRLKTAQKNYLDCWQGLKAGFRVR